MRLRTNNLIFQCIKENIFTPLVLSFIFVFFFLFSFLQKKEVLKVVLFMVLNAFHMLNSFLVCAIFILCGTMKDILLHMIILCRSSKTYDFSGT